MGNEFFGDNVTLVILLDEGNVVDECAFHYLLRAAVRGVCRTYWICLPLFRISFPVEFTRTLCTDRSGQFGGRIPASAPRIEAAAAACLEAAPQCSE